MAANSLLASAVQALCVVAWRGAEGANAELLARSLDTNPVVVRRILKTLERSGLVRLRPGRHGGVELSRSPAEISLEEIYRAVEPNGALFALRERGNPRCPVQQAMARALPPLFQAADEAVAEVLRRTSLDILAAQVPPPGQAGFAEAAAGPAVNT
ncbi:RrF2 family transcriptional regulator [Methylobacterium nonmethylotrophicum]|uniref:Rrf2 family transcriptional regulator n=1 Tax=Methylobacterium nonmethylotrophicum TaxID=1141884 RepID=A0A4Z0NVI6_9HYPH|nr:Rrf2 family transcriptional regulator [Methylobacterium nonmethylotrophicum]TGE01070.1 Rrf2 family transcriptional regulator [Methylobacterium nonmethylotrophicum]